MNSYLAELADICGIKKHLPTHTGRHTFATSVALTDGVSIENVAKMLGHSNTNMTRHYAHVLDKSIMRDMEAVNEKIKAEQGESNISTQNENPASLYMPMSRACILHHTGAKRRTIL